MTGPDPVYGPFVHVGDVWWSDVAENPKGIPDQITQGVAYGSSTEDACIAKGGDFPIDRGHIEVKG